MRPALPEPFYARCIADPPRFAPLEGTHEADLVVVGGGFTGLSAALAAAEAGRSVVLLEAGRLAAGASGRNGGQLHSGQRQDVLWLETHFGYGRALALWRFGEAAKAHVLGLIDRFGIECNLQRGLIHALHKPGLVIEAKEHVEALGDRYSYPVEYLGREETAAALGSRAYFGAIRDPGGAHLDPLRLAHGLARAAVSAGAALHEESAATALSRHGAGPLVRTARGEVRARHVIVATNGRSNGLERATRRRTLGINSYMVATEPLGPLGDTILPGGEGASDSRFVVRYWRKLADGRLTFGGGESNAGRIPSDIRSFVLPHLLDVYPQLKDVGIAHAWGGIVTVTKPRLPFVREIAPQVWAAAGFSGQGVGLAPYVGRLLVERLHGRGGELDLYTRLHIPPLPSSTWMRRALVSLAIWYGRLGD
ncbi:NAD(P)/FAD-dependent oxidoreductase [Propylenella binzhouense]|uniref:FAD-binding oxidoreductase n=1 Tax=Propylenella binzhouense TaxID=2555902 RepID=A0A964WS21_9HYPH|nr:FAD-binding oxidoreductase [Propylenella binzhouense]MYZ46385.1 FAD-binding oxidoreductase [Propylenella binzhouense]